MPIHSQIIDPYPSPSTSNGHAQGTLRQIDEDNGHTEWSGLVMGSIKSNIHIMVLVILVLLLDSFIIRWANKVECVGCSKETDWIVDLFAI